MDYKEKLRLAKEALDSGSYDKETIEYIFPELKEENEDERIQRKLINALKECGFTHFNDEFTVQDAIAWLEKQGEQKFVDKCKDCNNVKGCITCTDGNQYAHITEQKPSDKVEPKLEIEKGKWYVCNTSRYTDFVVGKAYYCHKNGMLKPNENEMARYVARNCFHLWTIQDAKDGDVLTTKDIVFIFKHMDKTGLSLCKSYCEVIGNSKLGLGFDFSINDVHPATKEQCDLLFSKMHEAGYEWDAKKKELKKLEKPIWNEEDKRMIDTIIYDLERHRGKEDSCYSAEINWLKSLKEK